MHSTFVKLSPAVTNKPMCFDPVAFDYLCDNIGTANLEQLVGASSNDIEFLSDILNDPLYAELIQVSFSPISLKKC